MPKGTERIRYAIYTRQSNQGLFDFASCDAPFRTCQEYAKQSGLRLLFRKSHHFKDEGYSGSTLDRPEMRRLRKVIALGGLHRVYAVAFDRLSRNMLDAVLLLDEFERAGVELRLVHQPDLDSTPHNRLLRHTLAAFAEFERDMIASRVAVNSPPVVNRFVRPGPHRHFEPSAKRPSAEMSAEGFPVSASGPQTGGIRL